MPIIGKPSKSLANILMLSLTNYPQDTLNVLSKYKLRVVLRNYGKPSFRVLTIPLNQERSQKCQS